MEAENAASHQEFLGLCVFMLKLVFQTWNRCAPDTF